MKALAVYPGKPHSMHVEEIPMPKVTDIPHGQGVLVKVLRLSADFVNGVNDLVKAEAFYPGWLNTLLTTKIRGLENYADMLRHLTQDKEAIKVFVEVAQAL